MKRTTALALIAFATAALAGCAPAPEPQAAPPASESSTPKPTSATEPTPSATPTAATCPTAQINFPTYAYNTEPVDAPELVGELRDTGPRDMVGGEPTLDDAGQIVSYTVQPGDAVEAIAARFCIDALSFGGFNNTIGTVPQPGDVLILRPDPMRPGHHPRE